MQGIDKNLAQQGRVLGAVDDAAFEHKVAEARAQPRVVFRCRFGIRGQRHRIPRRNKPSYPITDLGYSLMRILIPMQRR